MPNINLIAEQREALRKSAKLTRLWFIAFLGAAGIGLLSFGFLFIQGEALSAQLKNLKAKTEELKPIKELIEKTKQANSMLIPRVQTLQTARLDTERWFRVLDHFSMSVPHNTWLTQVTAVQPNEATKPVELHLTGMSAEQVLVGELMLRLQRLEDLNQLALKYTEFKKTTNGNGIEFQIACAVSGTEEQQKRTSDESKKKDDS